MEKSNLYFARVMVEIKKFCEFNFTVLNKNAYEYKKKVVQLMDNWWKMYLEKCIKQCTKRVN